MIGAWLLHGIRGSLSRPSEGLVSNYNLTIFLLAAEVRPVAHLLKLVQARTLHLQRIVASVDNEVAPETLRDLTTRLEELEAHIAEAAAARLESNSKNVHSQASEAPALINQAVVDTRRAVQPDIEALNRAVRRYEKRTALTAHQADMRFQQLEAQVCDAIALAASAQRSSASRSRYAFILIDWACACIVVPAQLFLSIMNLPSRAANRCLLTAKRMMGGRHRSQPRSRPRKGKAVSSR